MSEKRNAELRQLPGEQIQDTPGAFCFLLGENDERIGIVHSCPCGCKLKSALMFRGKGQGRPEWDVSGEWPKVSFHPSVLIANGHWHGWIKNGVWEEG